MKALSDREVWWAALYVGLLVVGFVLLAVGWL